MFHSFRKNKEELKLLLETSLPTYMDKVVECYITIMLIGYPLLLCKLKFFSISLQTNLFFITSIITMGIYLWQKQKAGILSRKPMKGFDILALCAFVWNLLFMIIKIIRVDIFYEPSIIVISLCFMYYLISRIGNFHRRYFYYFIFSAVIPICAVLFHFFINAEKTYVIDRIVKTSSVTASYALLVVVVGVLLYCTEKEKEFRILTAGVVGFASFVLFLQKSTFAVLIGGILFLIIPLLFVPTAELIKRNMQMSFLYFFVLSNMPLLTNYTKILKKEISFDITNSIYLDLVIAIIGFFFFSFWEKIPQEESLEEIILYRIRKIYRTILAAILLSFFMLAFAGNTIQTIPAFAGQDKIIQCINSIQMAYGNQEGVLYVALKEFGILGVAFFIILLAMIAVRVKSNYDKKSPKSAMLTTVFIMFFLQSIFYKPNALVTPIYFIVIILAVYSKKKRNLYVKEEKENEEIQEYRNPMEEETELDTESLEMFTMHN